MKILVRGRKFSHFPPTSFLPISYAGKIKWNDVAGDAPVIVVCIDDLTPSNDSTCDSNEERSSVNFVISLLIRSLSSSVVDRSDARSSLSATTSSPSVRDFPSNQIKCFFSGTRFYLIQRKVNNQQKLEEK